VKCALKVYCARIQVYTNLVYLGLFAYSLTSSGMNLMSKISQVILLAHLLQSPFTPEVDLAPTLQPCWAGVPILA